jgi:hypothetical protein
LVVTLVGALVFKKFCANLSDLGASAGGGEGRSIDFLSGGSPLEAAGFNDLEFGIGDGHIELASDLGLESVLRDGVELGSF